MPLVRSLISVKAFTNKSFHKRSKRFVPIYRKPAAKEAYKCFTWTHGALSARYAADPCSRARNLGMGVGTGRSADAGKWGRRQAAIQGESFSSRALGQPVARRRNSRSMSRAFRPAPARARVSRPEAAAPRSTKQNKARSVLRVPVTVEQL